MQREHPTEVFFGKHVGKTYAQIYNEYPQYAQWVLMTAQQEEEAGAQLLRLASYIQTREEMEASGLEMEEDTDFSMVNP